MTDHNLKDAIIIMHILNDDEDAVNNAQIFNEPRSSIPIQQNIGHTHQDYSLLERSHNLNLRMLVDCQESHHQDLLDRWESPCACRPSQYLGPPLIIFEDLSKLQNQRQGFSDAGQEEVQSANQIHSSAQQIHKSQVYERRQSEVRAQLEENAASFDECENYAIKISKNETKNIPKNYGKAIITFIEKNRAKVTELLQQHRISYSQLMDDLRRRKKGINTIADLRSLWTESKYSQQIRILSCLFLRKYSLQYIFNSRVSNYASHIKYRQKLRQALTDPEGFRNIKDY